jgi:hypothetical protein
MGVILPKIDHQNLNLLVRWSQFQGHPPDSGMTDISGAAKFGLWTKPVEDA